MVLSYSSVAKPSADTPKVINIASGPPATAVPTLTFKPTEQPEAGPSSPSRNTESASAIQDGASAHDGAEAGPSEAKPRIQHLILDAGPLLSFTPLRHLAQTFHTTPNVVRELRDPKAREHWERLKLGMDVRIDQPTPESMAKVVAFAKKTGDIAVLSQTDLGVIALTYQYESLENGEAHIRTEPGRKRQANAQAQPNGAEAPHTEAQIAAGEDAKDGQEELAAGDDEEEESPSEWEESDPEEEDDNVEERLGAAAGEESQSADDVEDVTRSIEQVLLDGSEPSTRAEQAGHETTVEPDTAAAPAPPPAPTKPSAQDEESESDGGEWITPSNVSQHRSRDLGLVTAGGKNDTQPIAAACMTGDFAVQNVLLGMGLGLVGEGGKRIAKVKSFVLRCHACFKICKDASKRFCPSCGNPSLMRTTVTTDSKGAQHLHLKKNFQYHLRGTKYSIPDPKMGRAKGQSKGGSGLILREDQAEWSDAVRKKEGERRKEEKKLAKGTLQGWNDPDWLPEIITVGMSGKGRQNAMGMPSIGHGRKNPNQARRKR